MNITNTYEYKYYKYKNKYCNLRAQLHNIYGGGLFTDIHAQHKNKVPEIDDIVIQNNDNILGKIVGYDEFILDTGNRVNNLTHSQNKWIAITPENLSSIKPSLQTSATQLFASSATQSFASSAPQSFPKYTNLNDTGMSYLVFKIDKKFQEIFPKSKTPVEYIDKYGETKILKTPNFFGKFSTGESIYGPNKPIYDQRNAALIKSDNQLHITFATFKIDERFRKGLGKFSISNIVIPGVPPPPPRLTFNLTNVVFLPNEKVPKKFISALYNISLDEKYNENLNNSIITNIIHSISYQYDLNLREYIYQKGKSGFICTSFPNIKDDQKFKGQLRIDFSTNYISDNVTTIKSYHHSDTGDEILRFYYYNSINYHISLTRQISDAQLDQGGLKDFNQSLNFLDEEIKKYIGNSTMKTIDFDITTPFEYI